MADDQRFLEVDISVDKNNYEEDILEIMKIIRPDWRKENIKFKPMAQGNVNLMTLCCHGDQADETSIVVRVFGNVLEDVVNRGNEIACAKCCDRLGLGPKVYCSFKNGLCTSYLKGRKYGWLEHPFKDIQNARIVAKTIAKYHCKATFKVAKAYNIGTGVSFIDGAEKILDDWPVAFNDPELHDLFYKDLPSKKELMAEVHFVQDLVTGMNLPVVFNHGDLNHTNFIHNEETGAMTFVDYEMCGFRTPVEDISIFFIFTSIGITEGDIEKHKPSREYVRCFVRTYLEELRRLDGEDEVLTQGEVERYANCAEQVYLILQLIHNIFVPQFVNTVDPGKVNTRDIVICFKTRLAYYFGNKARLLNTSQ